MASLFGNIFDKITGSQPKHVFAVLDAAELEEKVNYIKGERITKAKIQVIVRLFMPMSMRMNLGFPAPYGELGEVLRKMLAGNYYGYVDTLYQLVAHLVYAPGNLETAARYWPKSYVDTLVNAYANYYISTTQLATIAKMSGDMIETASGITMPVTVEMLENLLCAAHTSGPSAMYQLPPLLRGAIEFLPELGQYTRQARTTDVLPDTMQLTEFNGEADMVGLYGQLCRLMTDEQIWLQSTFTALRVSDVKTASALGYREMFAGTGIKTLKNYRARVVMLWAAIAKNYEDEDAQEMLRNFVKNKWFMAYNRFASTCLPHLDKPPKSYFDDIKSIDYLMAVINQLTRLCRPELGEGEKDVWIDAENLACVVLANLLKTESFGINTKEIGFGKRIYTDAGINITQGNIVHHITEPLIYGIFATLAALGVVEIAHTDVNEDSDSYFDSIRYVRLTRLGRYMVGKDSSYTGSADFTPPPVALYLDETRLIVLATDDATNAVMRTTIGRKISTNRYIVDDASIMRKVNHKRELKTKADMLLRMARLDKFPPVWADFFNNLLRKFDAIESFSIQGYSMYKIDPSNKAVQRLLTEDKDIRPLIILVEGGRFMVHSNDYDTLYNLLQAHGYTLPARTTWYSYR